MDKKMAIGDISQSGFWEKISVVAFFALVLFAGFVLASYSSTYSNGSSIGEGISDDLSTLVNITVNNTDGGYENVTAVVVRLPASVNFTEGTNSTTAGTYTFANTLNGTLNFSNVANGLILNGTTNVYFAFNVTPTTPAKNGILNISVDIYNTNSSVNVTTMNLTLNVNDTFSSSFISPSSDYSNVTALGLTNLTYSGNETAVSMNVSLYNSSGLVQSNLTSASPFVINWSAEQSSLADGIYTINVTVNNSASDSDVSSKYIVLDTTNPEVSLSRSSYGSTSLAVSKSCTDATSGVSSCTLSSEHGTINGNEISGLSCGTSYDITLSAVDYTDHSASTTVSMVTGSCGSGTGSSGGSGGQSWTNTYVDDDQDLGVKQVLDRQLAKNSRVRIKFAGETHYVGILDLSSGSAKVQVSSDAVEAQLNIGGSEKFNLNGDDYYDLMVTLNNITNNKADLTLNSIHEAIVVGEENGTASSGGSQGASGSSVGSSGSSFTWIVVIVVILAILGLAYYFFIKKGKF